MFTDVSLSNCKTVIPPLVHSSGRLSCPFPDQSALVEALLTVLPKLVLCKNSGFCFCCCVCCNLHVAAPVGILQRQVCKLSRFCVISQFLRDVVHNDKGCALLGYNRSRD